MPKSPRKSKSQAEKPTQALIDLMRENKPSAVDIQAYGGLPYLPTDYDGRKAIPIFTGVLDYFPLALLDVAKVSAAGNAQHNPGEELHWARGKSMDQMNTALRHMMERGNLDVDGVPHLAKATWRLLAALQIENEIRYGLPVSRGSWEAGRTK